MATWAEFEADAPDLAAHVSDGLHAGRHKVIATLRADGSPRISGIECEIDGGELRFGMMAGSRKLDDLRRDPRFALHGPTIHPIEGEEAAWPGEVKLAGRARLIGSLPSEEGEEPQGELFAAELSEVVFTHLDEAATLLVVEAWTPEGGLRTYSRA